MRGLTASAAGTRKRRGEPQRKSFRGALTLGNACALLTLLALSILLVYRDPNFRGGGPIDVSWRYALEYAYLNQLSFGSDTIFTSGPLSFVYSGLFSPKTYWLFVIGQALTVASIASVLYVSEQRLVYLLIFALSVLAFAPLLPDSAMYLTPFAVFVYVLSQNQSKWVSILFSLSLSVLALSKFTAFALAALLLALADMTRVLRYRDWPFRSPLFLLGSFALFVAIGQNPGAFAHYVVGSFEVADGYAKAMDNFGWGTRQTAYALAATTLGTAFLTVTWFGGNARDRLGNVGLVIGFCLTAFFVFKGTTVRVGHDTPSWSVLGLSSVLLASQIDYRNYWSYAGYALAVAGILLTFPASTRLTPEKFTFRIVEARRSSMLKGQFNKLIGFIHPGEKWRSFINRRAQMDSTLAARAPKGLSGTVGAVPWDLAELIAAGYDFVPQPSLQQYSSYSRNIRRKDAEHFASVRRPQNLAFSLKSIDHRYPPEDFGPSLLSIIQNYDLVDFQRGQFILSSRSRPRSVQTEILLAKQANMGEWIDVPAPDRGLIMMSAHLHQTILGRLITLLYKQPHLKLSLRFTNGAEREYRFIPANAADGFFLLPNNLLGPELFFAGEPKGTTSRDEVAAVRLEAEGMAEVSFLPSFELRFERVQIETHAEKQPDLHADPMLRLLTAKVEQSPALTLVPEGLLAHAPTTLVTSIPGGASLSGRFGILDRAWKTGRPKPITFAISLQSPDGARSLLFESTLDPVVHEKDRGSHSFEVAVPRRCAPPGQPCQLAFETKPATRWGLSYWGNLTLRLETVDRQ